MWFRLAALAAAALAAAPVLAQSPASPAPADKGPTTVDAEVIEGIGSLEVTARGKAEIKREDVTIFGDVLRYNREFGRIEGEGGVRLQQGLDRFFGPRLNYSTVDSTGTFEQPAFLIQREPTARGSAESMEFVGREHYRLKNALFTTCRPGQDDWVLEARELDLNYAEDDGVARGVKLRFFDVPVLGTPYVSFPLQSKRRSGLLAPYYSHTTTRGAEFGIPYYWDIAPERDLTITPVYMARRGLQVKNYARYMDRDYVGEARLEYLPDDKIAGRERQGMSLQHEHNFGPNMKAQIDYNRVSDDRYFTDLASQVRQLTTRNLPFDANLTYNGFFGDAPYTAQARMQRFQTLQDPLAPIVAPYQRVPQLRFNASQYGTAGFFDSTLPAEFVRFEHPTLVQGTRMSTNPTIAGAFVAPGWYFTPKAGVRAASWGLDRQPLADPGSAKIAIPWFSLDSGMTFERPSSWFGTSFTQTLEPRVFYVRVPFHRQDQIPLFDTSVADFNYPQLFSENRFVGGDRFGDANQLTLAASSRFLREDGQEAFRVTLGQRYYFSDERVALAPDPTLPQPTFAVPPLRTASDSNILASVGGRVYRHFTYDATTEYNRRADQTERYSASVRYAPEVAKVLSVSYRFNRAAIRQLDASTQWPIGAGWYGVGRYNYSILDKRLLEGIAGVEYNGGCWVFRAVVQKVQAITNVNTSQFLLQIEFNGVGQIGTDEAVELLKRNLPGYSVINPSDTSLAPPSSRPQLPFKQVF